MQLILSKNPEKNNISINYAAMVQLYFVNKETTMLYYKKYLYFINKKFNWKEWSTNLNFKKFSDLHH